MGIWNFIKGHDDLMSEIRNTSDPSIVVFKHPNEDFNTKSHLFLNPSEVALFVNTKTDGSTETLLMDKGGTLDTHNLPFFRSISQVFSGGQSFFHCAIYFVRTNYFVSNGWGTEAPIGPLEDCRHYHFKLVSNGSFDFRVTDAEALVSKILGTSGVTSETKDAIVQKLNPKISGFIGVLLSNLFRYPEMGVSLTRIQNTIRTEAKSAFVRIMNEMCAEKWGVTFSDFTMNLEDIYDGLADHYLKTNQMIQQTETIDYQGEAYSTIQLYEMLKIMAANPVNLAGSMMSMGVGAGVGAGLGGSIGSTIGSSIMNSAIGGTQATAQHTTVPRTGGRNWTGVPEHEKKRMDRQSRLKELKEYLDSNLIDQAAYDRKVNEIISEV